MIQEYFAMVVIVYPAIILKNIDKKEKKQFKKQLVELLYHLEIKIHKKKDVTAKGLDVKKSIVIVLDREEDVINTVNVLIVKTIDFNRIYLILSFFGKIASILNQQS